MDITSRWEKNARIIILTGTFVPSDWKVLDAAILAARIAKRPHIVINLEHVTFPDSAVLGKLFLTYLQLKQKRVRLSLINPQRWIQEKFERTNIPSLSIFYSSEEEALVAA